MTFHKKVKTNFYSFQPALGGVKAFMRLRFESESSFAELIDV